MYVMSNAIFWFIVPDAQDPKVFEYIQKQMELVNAKIGTSVRVRQLIH